MYSHKLDIFSTLSWRETNLDSILKSRDITLPKKFNSQSYGFPVIMYGCESWAIRNAEH